MHGGSNGVDVTIKSGKVDQTVLHMVMDMHRLSASTHMYGEQCLMQYSRLLRLSY